jgi:hypothetical protein
MLREMVIQPFTRSGPEHAEQLLRWLHANGVGGGWVSARTLIELHDQMCSELGWPRRSWAPVGRAFSKLTAEGRKPYRRLAEGEARVRVYAIPPVP